MDWDNSRPSNTLFEWILEISRFQIIWGGNYFADILPPSSCWLVWDKLNGEGSGYADCELAWTNMQKAVRRIQYRWAGMLQQDMKNKEERIHPTQKPIRVMKWCLEKLGDDVNSICDPFMGSGTTGISCANFGKKFIGIEKEPKYFDIACKRIEQAYAQPDLFVEPPAKAEQIDMLENNSK